MEKRQLIMTLQNCLLRLAETYIKSKGYNKPLSIEKEEFSIYNKRFTELVAKLPLEFYSNSTEHSAFVDEINELTNCINKKIESLVN